jgi:hypothetical protein
MSVVRLTTHEKVVPPNKFEICSLRHPKWEINEFKDVIERRTQGIF